MNETAAIPAAPVAPARFSDYLEMTKPRLSLLSVLTALVGYLVAPKGSVPSGGPWTFLYLVLGTSFCAGGVAALNQLMERDTDARMARTADRPLPTGKVATGSAFVLGWGLCMVGLAMLFRQVSEWSGFFAVLTIVTYLAFYTPAKRWSHWSVEIGAVAGALPPLIGWSAAVDPNHPLLQPLGWILFALMFFWQIPHFMAVSWTYRHDYAKVNFPFLPVRDGEGGQVARRAFVTTVCLVAVTLLPFFFGEVGWAYFAVTLLLGAWFLLRALIFLRPDGRDRAARSLFIVSILWLPLQLGALVVARLLHG